MGIPNLTDAWEHIKEACEQKIKFLYPVGVPDEFMERYRKELEFLKTSSALDDFEIFRCLSEEAAKSALPMGMRGTASGSILLYLLGVSGFDPMPAHYDCMECGYTESVDTKLFGIDLPEKNCPKCGHVMTGRGFRLPVESVWGNDGKKKISFDYNVCREFFPFACRVLKKLYPENQIVPWGIFKIENDKKVSYPSSRAIGVEPAGYVILPAGHTLEDYQELVSFLEDGESCIAGSVWELEAHFMKPIRMFPAERLDLLLKLQRVFGIYANELTERELGEIAWNDIMNTAVLSPEESEFFHALEPKTYKDMVNLESCIHSTFTFGENGKITPEEYQNMTETQEFRQCPCLTREDFFENLLERGMERKMAFTMSENLRKSRRTDMEQLPDECRKMSEKYRYIFPRAHCAEYIMSLAKIAYYAKIDHRKFAKIKYRKN